jgi:hypothetical protein
MKELRGDLFKIMLDPDIDAICISTNGNYSRQCIAFMNNGVAKVVSERWEKLKYNLGRHLRRNGKNIPYVIGAIDENGDYIDPNNQIILKKEYKCLIFSFPTMINLNDVTYNIDLIKQSSKIMIDYAKSFNLHGIAIAGLQSNNVKKEIEDILDDRFIILLNDYEY